MINDYISNYLISYNYAIAQTLGNLVSKRICCALTGFVHIVINSLFHNNVESEFKCPYPRAKSSAGIVSPLSGAQAICMRQPKGSSFNPY